MKHLVRVSIFAHHAKLSQQEQENKLDTDTIQ